MTSRSRSSSLQAGCGQHIVAIALAALLSTGCYEPGPTATDELVGELRALRRQHAAMANNGTAALAALPPAALQPLRDALTELVQSQRQIEARQLALTQEMQRWSSLVVATVAKGGGDAAKTSGADAEAMLARLGQLEQELRAQDARHQRVEALLGGALDRTAERLEEFLQRVGPRSPQQVGGEVPGASAPASTKAPSPASTNPASTNPGSAGPGSTSPPAPPSPRDGAPEHPREDRGGAGSAISDAQRANLERIGWLVLAAMSFGAGCWFLLLARRGPPLPQPEPQPTDGPQAATETPPPAAAPTKEADDLWRAAAMLGEVVGRLRQSPGDLGMAQQLPSERDEGESPRSAAPDTPAIVAPAAIAVEPAPRADLPANRAQPDAAAEAAAATGREAALASTESLGTESLGTRSPEPEAPSSPKTLPPRRLGTGRPQAFICQLQPRDVDGALQILPKLLAQDPRVLRWPSPTIVRAGGGIEVSFLLVPAVPPGERGQIEQSLREACR